MEHRQLGKNGPEVSVLGLGAWPLGGGMGQVDEATAIATARTAIDCGITLIDTAQAYLASETLLGKALKDGYRERCFLATKASKDFSRQGIRAAIEDSLRALQVDYVDLYQLHRWMLEYPLEESLETMARLQEEGKTRFIGVSNYNAEQMKRALQITPFHSNQPSYNLFDQRIEAEDIPFCEQASIGILAHSALAKGLLTGKYQPDHQFPADDERSRFPRFQGETFARYLAAARDLEAVAHDKGLTLVQLAIAWQLRLPAVTCSLIGAKSPQQVEAYLGAESAHFTESELATIDQILAAL